MIQIAFDPIYAHPLPENHRFPMLKYELIPRQLLHEGTCTPAQAIMKFTGDTSERNLFKYLKLDAELTAQKYKGYF
jgi:hypothetical protein